MSLNTQEILDKLDEMEYRDKIREVSQLVDSYSVEELKQFVFDRLCNEKGL